jgi:hypothetical protein
MIPNGITHASQEQRMAKKWIAVLRAADAAARWHVHQRRKGEAERSTVFHC